MLLASQETHSLPVVFPPLLMLKIENYIGGEMVKPASGEYLENFNPATGEVYSLIPDSDDRDVHLAVQAGQNAFPAWSKTSPEERFSVIMRLVALIERDSDELALAESIDNGKTLAIAKRLDIPRAAANFRFYATAAMHTANESHDTVGQNALNYTLRQPLGVVGCISPWNLPLYLFTDAIAPMICTPRMRSIVASASIFTKPAVSPRARARPLAINGNCPAL